MHIYDADRNSMLFKEVCEVFEKIGAVSGRLEITRLLADLFKHAKPQEAEIIANLSLGMLRPPYKGSTQFNLAEKNLIKVAAQLLDESESKIEAEMKKAGDLGLVVEQGRWHVKHHPTLTEVYKSLVDIEKLGGTGSAQEKINATQELLKQVEPFSAKYIVRIILGTLRLGFSDMTIVDALSWMEKGDKSARPALESAYNICADIGLVARELKAEGLSAIEHMKVHIGVPIRPALAERLPSAKDIFEKLGRCVAQPKYDGFRVQIHSKKVHGKHEVHFFSRNLIDMSHMFPDLVKEMERLNVDSIICEGEAIVFDEETGKFLPFQETVKRKRKHGIEEAVSDYPLQVHVFDLMYLNGENYLDKTSEERRNTLVKLLSKFKSDVFKVVDEQWIDSAKELEEYFLKMVDAGLEGIIVKKPDSHYQPGKRNFNWIKLKRHQAGHLEDTIDCVILGYYAGSGKRASFGIGAFLVGVFNEQKDMFQTVAKIGTGLSDEEWKDLKKACDKLKVPHKPTNVECAKELFPDVWVSPEIVCEAQADEITMSPLHAAGKTPEHLGMALRFPRFVKLRTDKSARQATSVKELKSLFKDQFSSSK